MASKTNKPDTKTAIIDAAISLLASNGNSTLGEIAIKAGVGRATLHRHFRSREDLINAIQHLCASETEAAVAHLDNSSAKAISQLHDMFAAVIPLGHKFHFLYSEYNNDDELKQRYQEELDWLTDLVEALKKDGDVAQEIPTSWAVAQIDQLIWVAWSEVGKGNLRIEDAPALAMRTFTKGHG